MTSKVSKEIEFTGLKLKKDMAENMLSEWVIFLAKEKGWEVARKYITHLADSLCEEIKDFRPDEYRVWD